MRRWVLGIGAVLGLTAFGADYLDGWVQAALSSAAVWGSGALVAGRRAETRRQGAVAGAGALVVATLVYYLLIVFVSRRWQGQFLEDGSSGDMNGLLSIARATGFWLAGSVVGGAVLGLLGRLIAEGSAIAAGVAWALLAGQGIATLTLSGVVLATVVVGLLVTRQTKYTTAVLAAVVAGAASAGAWYVLQYALTYGLLF
ncbi:hypothetical protein [Dactylosporangium sp. CA-233914]|uniref:hypothetical protein n=1 Tax=Dactylosporangium sp. CA-233914 TaxID=3239934 RepID=UPI003D8D8F86